MAARRSPRNKDIPDNRALAPVSKALAPAGSLNDSWRQRLAKYAERDAATATGAEGWKYVGTKGGIFRFNDEPLEQLPPMIILGAMFENAFYEGKYDAENPSGPKCFAIAREEKLLAPPETLGDKRQCLNSEPASESCAGCWANAFGTADQGRGKACKNVRRLAMIPADVLDAKTLSQVEGAMLRLSVTSVKNYSTYANKVTKGLGIPLFMMRTRINIEQDDKSQFKITFEPYDMQETKDGIVPLLIQDEQLLGILEQRVNEADAYLEKVPTASDDEVEKPKNQRRALPARAGTNAKAPARRAVPAKADAPAGRAVPRKAGGRPKATAPANEGASRVKF